MEFLSGGKLNTYHINPLTIKNSVIRIGLVQKQPSSHGQRIKKMKNFKRVGCQLSTEMGLHIPVRYT